MYIGKFCNNDELNHKSWHADSVYTQKESILNIEIYGKSHTGLKRKNNQDSCYFNETSRMSIVADGIGGRKAGEVASKIAVDTVSRELSSEDMPKTDVSEKLIESVQKANKNIIDHGQSHNECKGMATTIDCVYFYDDQVRIAHVGDSRTYLFYQNQLWQLTLDHNVGTFRDRGIISPDISKSKIQEDALLRALGLSRYIDVDVYKKKIEVGEIYLSASDGLFNMVDQRTLLYLIQEYQSNIKELTNNLIHEANKNGGKDNITVVICKVLSL